MDKKYNQSLSNPQPNPALPEPPKYSFIKRWLPVIVAIFVLVVGLGGFFAWQYLLQSGVETPSVTLDEQDAAELIEEDTATSLVSDLQEVQEWMRGREDPYVILEGVQGDSYVVRVANWIIDHEEHFGWYLVNKEGDVERIETESPLGPIGSLGTYKNEEFGVVLKYPLNRFFISKDSRYAVLTSFKRISIEASPSPAVSVGLKEIKISPYNDAQKALVVAYDGEASGPHEMNVGNDLVYNVFTQNYVGANSFYYFPEFILQFSYFRRSDEQKEIEDIMLSNISAIK